MICQILHSNHSPNSIYMEVMDSSKEFSSDGAWDLADMLASAFSTNSPNRNWRVCCFNGYENAIEFVL